MAAHLVGMRARAILLAAFTACGRVGFDPTGAATGDASGDGSGIDGAVGPPFDLVIAGPSSMVNHLAAMPDGGVAFVGAALGPATIGSMSLPGVGGADVLFGVLDRDGTVVWARLLGSTGDDQGRPSPRRRMGRST